MADNAKAVKLKKGAPTLYLIIIGKLIKGALALALAFGVLKLAGQNLPDLFDKAVRWVHLDPENRFLSDIDDKLDTVTSANMRRVAVGTFLYSLFSLVEGVGLIFRAPWAGWLAIGESAFFIPIEIREMVHRPVFSWVVCSVLVINVIIVWYLLQNRKRLFHHHH